MKQTLLLLSIISSGLVGGLLYGWTVSVLPGLRRITDTNYVSTMQSINRQIINPLFTIPYIIAPAILAVAAVVHFRAGQNRRAGLLASASVTYLVGVIGVTFGGNIPLNNTLDAFDLGSSGANAITSVRSHYEGRWNSWHYARTVASVVAFSLTTAAAVAAGEAD